MNILIKLRKKTIFIYLFVPIILSPIKLIFFYLNSNYISIIIFIIFNIQYLLYSIFQLHLLDIFLK